MQTATAMKKRQPSLRVAIFASASEDTRRPTPDEQARRSLDGVCEPRAYGAGAREPIPQPERKKHRCCGAFFCQRATKRCVKWGKND